MVCRLCVGLISWLLVGSGAPAQAALDASAARESGRGAHSFASFSSPATAPLVEEGEFYLYWWLALGVGLAVLVGFLLYRRYRSPGWSFLQSQPFPSSSAYPFDTLPGGHDEETFQRRRGRMLGHETAMADELAAVEAEAEAFLLAGRMGMAIGVLRHYIESHEDAPAGIWLTLLDVLHREGLRREFEKLAARMKARFNVSLFTWEDANRRSSGLSGLEHFPHLLARISARWGQPGCLEELNDLVLDNRDGERGGFNHEAFRDLLLLIGVLEKRGS